MCLRIQSTLKTADEDIVCYKVLQKNMRSYHYSDFIWEIGKTYSTKMDTIDISTKMNAININGFVEKGFHSYSSLIDAKREYFQDFRPCIIVECIIPKDADYYIGTQPWESLGYASNQLMVKRVISKEELSPDFNFETFPYKEGQQVLITKKGFKPFKATIETIQPYKNFNMVFVLTDSLLCRQFNTLWNGTVRNSTISHIEKVEIIKESI